MLVLGKTYAETAFKPQTVENWVAVIALWFRLRLPSCGPGFESQALHLCFFQFVIDL